MALLNHVKPVGAVNIWVFYLSAQHHLFLLLIYIAAYVDGGIKAGELNIKCPLMTCEKMIAPSQFVNLVSPDDKNNRRRG